MADETPTTIAEAIQQSAIAGKASVSAGGTSVSAVGLESQIAADKYVKGEAAKSSPGSGFRVQYITPRRGGFR